MQLHTINVFPCLYVPLSHCSIFFLICVNPFSYFFELLGLLRSGRRQTFFVNAQDGKVSRGPWELWCSCPQLSGTDSGVIVFLILEGIYFAAATQTLSILFNSMRLMLLSLFSNRTLEGSQRLKISGILLE